MYNARVRCLYKTGKCPPLHNNKNLNGVLFSQNMNFPGSAATVSRRFSAKVLSTHQWNTLYVTNPNVNNFESRNIPRNTF